MAQPLSGVSQRLCDSNASEEDNMVLDPVLQELVDKAAIRDLMARYARGIDRPDMDLIASSFTLDAHAEYGRWQAQGRDDIVDKLRPSISRTDSSTHFMGDQQFQFSGDVADVETNAIIYIVYTVEGTQYQSIAGIHYEDKMVRHDGGWQVQNRIVHSDWRRGTRVDTSLPGIDQVPLPQ